MFYIVSKTLNLPSMSSVPSYSEEEVASNIMLGYINTMITYKTNALAFLSDDDETQARYDNVPRFGIMLQGSCRLLGEFAGENR